MYHSKGLDVNFSEMKSKMSVSLAGELKIFLFLRSSSFWVTNGSQSVLCVWDPIRVRRALNLSWLPQTIDLARSAVVETVGFTSDLHSRTQRV